MLSRMSKVVLTRINRCLSAACALFFHATRKTQSPLSAFFAPGHLTCFCLTKNMPRHVKGLPGLLFSLAAVCAPLVAHGGGSGLNTVVVANQASSNSVALANYYCERRQIPPNNVLNINWSGGNIAWTNGDFQTNLLVPLLNFIASHGLTNQVDYVVLSMDIPFQLNFGTTVNSTTTALFYGLKPGGGTDWKGVTNSYCWSESVFRQAPPASASGYSFLATMLTANTLDQAKQLVDQGVNSDGTFPTVPVVLAKTSDVNRNIRYTVFDNAIFNTRLRGNYQMWRTNTDNLWMSGTMLGCENGLQNFSLPPNTFVPGAIADDLTSFSGIIFGYNDQTTSLAFIAAGASGSYGTVTEPSADPAKFPDPQDYFYQARGFTLAECYYQSIYDPFQGLIVAEPLAAPFAQSALPGTWSIQSNAVLSGTTTLSTRFAARDAAHPLQQIDLFIDGLFFQTLTNVGPAAGNSLTVTLNGYPVSYSIPPGATLTSAAAGLANQINVQAVTNITRIVAIPHGDRIDLRSLSTDGLADPFFFADTTSNPAAVRFYRVTYLNSPRPQMSIIGKDPNGAVRLHATTGTGTPFVIQASTNLVDWVALASNPGGGPLDFVDTDAPHFPRRFYRVVGTVPDPRPRIYPPVLGPGGPSLHMESASTLPYGLLTSTNLHDWTPVFTNTLGGSADFVDTSAPQLGARFYRAALVPPPTPQASAVPYTSPNSTLLRVTGALQPYVIEISSNLDQWVPIYTNLAVGKPQTTVSASAGTGSKLATFISASQPAFLDSAANGLRTFTANGIFQVGTWLQLDVTKTNGTKVSVSVTNQSSTATILDLTTALANQINATRSLMGSDGVIAEDVTAGAFGSGVFNLRVRSPGYFAAALQARLGGTSRLVMSPKTVSSVNANMSDLQPRNHLYLTAGAQTLAAKFALNTASLPDGYHELIAVAYEGSNVRTQTRSTVPVYVRNSTLTATLVALDFADTAPVSGTYHLQVQANTNSVSTISLFSTGGLLGSVTNQSSPTFTISGAALGAGLHPFYALVQTNDGRAFRTPILWLRLN